MIRIGKITKPIFNKDDYYIFSAWTGEDLTIIYRGDNPPKPLKTVDYKMIGDYSYNKKYGKQLTLREYEKVGKIKIADYNDEPVFDHKNFL